MNTYNSTTQKERRKFIRKKVEQNRWGVSRPDPFQ